MRIEWNSRTGKQRLCRTEGTLKTREVVWKSGKDSTEIR